MTTSTGATSPTPGRSVRSAAIHVPDPAGAAHHRSAPGTAGDAAGEEPRVPRTAHSTGSSAPVPGGVLAAAVAQEGARRRRRGLGFVVALVLAGGAVYGLGQGRSDAAVGEQGDPTAASDRGAVGPVPADQTDDGVVGECPEQNDEGCDGDAGQDTVQDGTDDDAHVEAVSDALVATGLDPTLARRLARAQAAAEADGVVLTLTSGKRTAEEQEGLVAAAIKRYGSKREASRWVLPPESSAHVQGLAVDVGPTEGALWLGEHGLDFGLCRTYANEVWHFEALPKGATTCAPMAPDSSSGW
ncbi:M15 family metallopeptidase [Cellulomonas sp. A375-1]|uniref:M15 family metallopeptidase n=1 Tax=Cellulomonas sp. A375-1 TaxID=1672219 RepID=UPI0009E3C7ED|nr:M15 family metallopeptidase [Cellulomonas sp. A375-1]